ARDLTSTPFPYTTLFRSHFLPDLFRIGRSRTQNYLHSGVQVFDRIDQVDDALLPRNPADKQDVRFARVDAVRSENSFVGTGAVFIEVDTVWNDSDFFQRDTVKIVYVLLHRIGHGYDAVRILIGRSFDPRGGMIGRTKLLDLPWPVGFK